MQGRKDGKGKYIERRAAGLLSHFLLQAKFLVGEAGAFENDFRVVERERFELTLEFGLTA